MTHTGELARQVDEVTGGAGPGRSLRHGSLRFLRTVALPIGVQGPTAGVIIGPAIIAGIVGEPGALAQVLALVTMGFVAYAFVVFTRSFNTAGSVYAFNATRARTWASAPGSPTMLAMIAGPMMTPAVGP